jgi:hypothetical protein
MSGRDLQWSELDVPIGGLNESTDRRLLQPGELSSIYNCEYSSKDGSVSKRPGTSLVCSPPLGSDGVTEIGLSRLAVHDVNNQLIGIDLVGNFETSCGVYSIPADSAVRPKYCGTATPFLSRRYPLGSDLQSDIITDSAYVATSGSFGYRVYGFVHQQSHRCIIRIDQVLKGSSGTAEVSEVYSTILEELVSFTGSGDYFWVRCAPCLDEYVLVAFGRADGEIQGIVVDLSGAVPTTLGGLGSLTTIVTADATTLPTNIQYFDLCESTTTSDLFDVPNWLLAYRSTADDMKLMRIAGPLITTIWDVNVDTTAYPLGMSVLENAGIVWTNYFAPSGTTGSWTFGANATEDGAILTSPTIWFSNTGMDNIAGQCSAIAYANSTSEVMLFHSQQAGNTLLSSTPRMVSMANTTSWARVDTIGNVGVIGRKYGIRLWSKPWLDQVHKKWLAWCGALSNSSYTTGASLSDSGVPNPQNTGVLMRFAEDITIAPETEVRGLGQVVASTGGYTLAQAYDSGYAYGGAHLSAPTPQSVTYPLRQMSSETEQGRLGRRTVLHYRFLPTESRMAPYEMVVRDNEDSTFPDGYGRCQSTRCGGSVYLTGGVLTQWTGSRVVENNYVKAPWIAASLEAGDVWLGNFTKWGGQHLYLQAVWESVLDSGERVRSATSEVLDILLDGTVDVTAPAVDITVYVDTPSLRTMTYDYNPSSGVGVDLEISPQTIVTIYGSTEPNGQVLHRFFSFGPIDSSGDAPWEPFISHPDEIGPLSFIINGITSPYAYSAVGTDGIVTPMDSYEVIYNDSGELDNDFVWGGCTCQTVHKERLWVGGNGDEPDVVWYSKERVDGRVMEFSLGQQVRLPGKKVVALASLDDAMIALCENGIYAIYGDGPNATGDSASGTFTVVPISTAFGCTSPLVTVTPAGVIFQSVSGLALLDRGRSVKQISNVNVSSSSFGPPIAAVVAQDSPQSRILYHAGPLVFGEGNALRTRALVYDWEVQRWAIWEYNHDQASVVDQKVYNGYMYVLTSDGKVHIEFDTAGSDSGEPFSQTVQFGWISFGRLSGYKRLHRMGLLLQPNAWADFSVAPENMPFGLRATIDYKWAEVGSSSDHVWSSYALGQTLPTDGITSLSVHMGRTSPSVRLSLSEETPVNRITGTDTAATVSTVGANVLRIRFADDSTYYELTITSGAARTKAQVAADLNTELAEQSLDTLVRAYVSGSNQIVLENTWTSGEVTESPYLEVDNVGNGSTLNTPLGFDVSGEVGVPTVSASSQSGFILQGLSFEVGHAKGLGRWPAAQSR